MCGEVAKSAELTLAIGQIIAQPDTLTRVLIVESDSVREKLECCVLS